MGCLAAVLREYGKPLTIEEVQLESPRMDEMVIRNTATGVCGTDITMINTPDRAPLPIVLGHEGAGIVEEVGTGVTEFSPGDHVVMSYGHCGKCADCLAGMPFRCSQSNRMNFGGSRLDGTSPISKNGEFIHGMFFRQSSFAEYSVVKAQAAVKVSKDIDLTCLAPFGCGVLTGAGTVFHIFKAQIGSNIAIFGVGTVGLSAVMAASVASCRTIIAVDINKDKLEKANELGATHCINPSEDQVSRQIHDITGGGADFAFDTTGKKEVIHEAFESLKMTGQCAVATGFGVRLEVAIKDIMRGKSLRGVVLGDSVPRIFIPQLIELKRQGKLPVEQLITKYRFSEINEAIEDFKKGSAIKPVLIF